MGGKKAYEEKQRHGTVALPVGLHKMAYPDGTDVIFYLHWHQEFEFLVLTKGEIVFSIEDKEYKLQKGDGVFIHSNLLHSARSVDKKACSFFAVVFSYEALDNDIHSVFAKKYIRPVLNGKFLLDEFLSERFEENSEKTRTKQEIKSGGEIPEIDAFLEHILQKKQVSWQQEVLYLLAQIGRCPEHELESHELLVRSTLLSVWNLMYSHGRSLRKDHLEEQRLPERLSAVIDYMKENYAYEITLAELAGIIPMSEGQFCRIFKKNLNMSPMQYLLRYRILQSCRYLQDTDKKIGEIANLTGFNNISYFNKVFLKTIGCTPGEYRNNRL
ncbi:MAG: AraC family transcriptional regulator [Clostridiaceae bacterium]|nr:AraC family transcriptional regulator [Clostridiaceae bacterium]